MRTLLALVVALPALLALGTSSHASSRGAVSRALLAQMNGSSAGQITRTVDCRLATPAQAHGGLRYTCVLTGRLASQHAFVTVNGTSWRAEYAPLHG